MLTSFFWSGDVIRSRRVSSIVRSATLDIPMPPARLIADWQREIATNMVLEPGDVEVMPLARARARWPNYTACVQAMSAWLSALGLPGVLASSDVALMACRGARYHHDASQYGGAAFCNLFVSEDRGQDVHFPGAGRRIPLTRGTALLFDTGQPHGVIRRDNDRFDATAFAPDDDAVQIFLTWELAIEDPHVSEALDIAFDVASAASTLPDDEQVRFDGEPVVVCPDTGRWRRASVAG
ncbi:hypothetical protein LFL96_25525 [Paraburkholderia sp. D15]|uniref:hypothetical protein n=1 Tax=Paraburkholderia sp. D15 TaxID=2880218 RepID=UPI002479BF8F|nr:hypothetical protein [Paraburkholderia sp. D15]WGS54377.1 hypothetical protein LFL96_25525 [Paraburkholderia sp. D15]